MDTFIQLTINGFTLGSVYALIALGYSLVYGILKLLNFAPDISGIATSKTVIDGWKRDNPSSELESFGPPTYGAVQVALRAVKAACVANNNVLPDRRAVLRKVKQVVIPNWILGGTFRFSTKSNDPLNAKFYIFQIQSNGTYKLVG